MSQNTFTQREVREAFRDFSDLARDAEYSDYHTWPENLRQLLHFCENNPVMKTVLEPLRDTSLFDYQQWEDRVVRDGNRTNGLFPSDDDQRMALFYQILLKVNQYVGDHASSYVVHFVVKLYGVMINGDESLNRFRQEIFTKFVRTVGYRLERIAEDIAGETEVSRTALIAFTLNNHGTLIAGDIKTDNNSSVSVG